MPLAHLCPQCGTDLAYERAQMEPHYGLMIVHCPGCRRAAVRQPHPLRSVWRNTRRLDWALTILVFSGLAYVGLVISTTAITLSFVQLFADRTMLDVWPRWALPMVMGLVAWPIFVGTWLTFAFPHWRRAASSIVFFLLVASCMAVFALIEAVERPGAVTALELEIAARAFLRGTALLYLMMLVSILGRYPGAAILAGLRALRRTAWRVRRRRQRRERTG